MNNAIALWEAGTPSTSLEALLAMSDSELDRKLYLVQSQIRLAGEQKNDQALIKLQGWEEEIIAARFIRLTRGDK